ncbi:diguanylate cyclase, partial [uncultured Bilophila sp.]|uniref:diguanylate cyclase n=1 Tax=uncultured Bilophila sp. TaxID=529385 RepID=UPI00261ABB28
RERERERERERDEEVDPVNQGSWKTLRLYALYSLGAAIVLSAIFLFYLHRTETAIEAQAETQLAEVTRQYTKAIETDLEGNLQLVRALALALGRLGVSAPSEILPLLRDESILGGYKRMGVITLDGMAHTTDGREFDASDRAYFRRALQSESTLAAMLVDKTDKRPINVYAAPILHGDHVAAVLFATVPTDAFLNHIDDRLFNGRGQVLVTDVSGAILFRGKGQVRLNRYANISELFPFEAPPPGEADSMHAGHQGMFHYEGQTFFIAHTPMTFLTHWNVYSLVPESTLNADAGSIQQGVLLLLLFFILMSMFFLGFIMRMQGGYTRRLEKARQMIDAMIRNIPGGFFRYDAKTQTFDYVSEGFLKLLGHTHESFKAACSNRFDLFIHEEDRARVLESIRRQTAVSDYDKVEYRARTADGHTLWLFDNGQLVRDDNGEWFYVIVMDITPLRNAQQELRISEERYRIITELSESIIFEHDLRRRRFYLSPRFREKFGYTPDVDTGSDSLPETCIYYEDRQLYTDFVATLRAGRPACAELRLVRHPSGSLWCRVSAAAIFDDANVPVRVVGDITDIDRAKRTAERLRLQAETDPLTGLYNKRTASARIAACLEEGRPAGLHALLVIDINHFKRINDTCGHLSGDEALAEMARRLLTAIRQHDIAGRVGGDEFIVLLRDVPDRDTLAKRLQSIRDTLSFSMPEFGLRLSASIGAAVFPEDARTYTELFQLADKDMYRVKKERDKAALHDAAGL